jgi:hypothetical protein
MFATTPTIALELFDISNMTLKSSIADEIDAVKSVHPNFKCMYGFLNFGAKKVRCLNIND